MQIVVTRKRVTGTLPQYEYRLFVPFDQLSPERQSLIHYRTDFGRQGGPHARLTEVIAAMDYLMMAPGLARYDRGRAIARIAKRIEAIVIRALFPEMTAALVPILFLNETEFDDTLAYTRMIDLAGRHDWLARIIDDVTAEGLALGFAKAA